MFGVGQPLNIIAREHLPNYLKRGGISLDFMPRVNQLIDNPEFEKHMLKIQKCEERRKYCKHGFEHGLAVARIAHAFLLEQEEKSLDKEVVYAAALLHDIGRWVEYETGKDHAQVSAELAETLLIQSGFNTNEINLIKQGIMEHRRNPEDELTLLGRALALADDWARDCRQCSMHASCYKFTDSMLRITY